MDSAELVALLTQLMVMLAAGVLLGMVLRKLKQPSVVGEMAAGVLIGVTVLGTLAPDVFQWLFVDPGDQVAGFRRDLIKIGVLFFLYVAGSEVDLSDVKTLGPRSLIIGFVGTVLPIALGIGLVYVTPVSMWGESVGIGRLPFAAFIGMNLANSANPVLARILIDLGMMKSRIATVMMTATIIDDLVNWTLYAIILGSVKGLGASSDRGLGIDLLLVALLFVFVLGVVRWLAPKLVGFARRHLAWPNGYVAVATFGVLGVGALSEAIGVQAFLGAFLAGVAFSGVAGGVGATGHKSIVHVAIGFFAPLFFVQMALQTDFIKSFDPVLVVTVTLFALASKLISVVIGVKAAGLPVGREAWAMAWGLNARGATGIILAATGLQVGIISAEVFVALVVMAIVTSILAGPMMVRSLGPLAKDYISHEDEEALPDEGPVPAATARIVDRDLTEAERADLEAALLYRVVVAIDDPETAAPLVEAASQLAASQQPAEVVLALFRKQTDVEGQLIARALDAIVSDIDSLRGLEEIVQSHGLTATSVSQRSSDLGTDIATRTRELGAHALVVGDRRDDPDWVATVDRLIAASPADIYVVVAPLPRAGAPARTGPPIVEVGPGLAGEAALEAAVRFALSGAGGGPTVVGLSPKSKSAGVYRNAIDRLAGIGRQGRVVEVGLDTVDGFALAGDAGFVIRPFSAPEGLEPVERARPDAERFGCPVVLVAPDPDRTERVSLAAVLNDAEKAMPVVRD